MYRELYVLGTGNANAVNCYNTCFALRDDRGAFLLTDAGGGNGILKRLREMDIPLGSIRDLILTHAHTDHILGVIWVLRMVAAAIIGEKYEGTFTVYGHEAAIGALRTFCELTLQKKQLAVFDDRILFRAVTDGETRAVNGTPTTFFDIRSTKMKQFGFTLPVGDGKKLTCLGDEPYNPACETYASGADWLLSEAFCLYEDRDRFHPYEKHHSTARDAALLAAELEAENLVLWHTEDTDLTHRKARYTAEAKTAFTGNVFVPEDGEILTL